MPADDENEEKPKENNSGNARSILSNFASSTTAHGCSQINQSQSSVAKCVWLLIFIGCTIGAIICITALLQKYFAFPTKDVIVLKTGAIAAPSISVCSLNPIPSSFRTRLSGIAPDNKVNTVLRALDLASERVANTSFGLHEKLSESYLRLNSYIWIYENAPGENETLQFAHELDDLVVSCMYQGIPCDKSTVKIFTNPYFYKCYTFNAMDYNDTYNGPFIHSTGTKSGISMLFFLDTHDSGETLYNPYCPLGGNTGVRVVIHQPGTIPDPFNDGFDVAPGYSTNVGITKRKRELLGRPWGDCERREKLDDGLPFLYDRRSCKLLCLQAFVAERCGCVTSYLPISENMKNITRCGQMDLENFNSASPNLTTLEHELDRLSCELKSVYVILDDQDDVDCDCPQSCERDIYDYTLSQSEWPSGGVQLHFYRHIAHLKGEAYFNSSMYHLLDDKVNTNDSMVNMKNQRMIQQNFLRVNTFFTSMDTEIVKQVEEYPFTDMISGVGGGFGVYVGFSIVTMCEFCVLFVHLLRAMIMDREKRKVKSAELHSSKVIPTKTAW
ncbi:unnamed protein product [Owenia fusiformis]|uniref:Uncharacterized protein n=1 Tax=Owenia fusiformis TaxID=6347 RepID=A0A8J1Y9E6_OWEFU|nr:unnamed protein product [Owenia fusiformis]